MDEEILEALTKANAVDQETGLSIGKLMELTTRNLDTVVMNVRRLRRDRRVQVSNENHLSNNADHAWPVTRPIEVTGEAVAQAKRDWKEQNHKPIIVWLGPVILKEIEEKRKDDEFRDAIKTAATRDTVSVHGDNSGQIAVGRDIQQTQQAGDHSSSSQRNKNERTAHITNKKRNDTLKAIGALVIASLAAYIGGKLLEVF